MRIKIASLLIVATLIFASSSFSQETEPEGGNPIPAGHKVIAIKLLRKNAMDGQLVQGDRVDLIDTKSSMIVATLLENDLEEKCIVGLLTESDMADQIHNRCKSKKTKISLRPAFGEKVPQAEHIRSVRELASRLDLISAELESLEAYSRADELRQYAQKLRVDVR